MALRLTDKASALLKLLLALRFPDVRRAATAAGYDAAKSREGWNLLQAASGSRLDLPEPTPGPKDDGAVSALDDWENQWYPVIEATLKFNFPAVHATVFLGIVQTSGRELLVTVPKLLERLAQTSPEVKTLLAERKVTEAVLAQAAGLVARIREGSDEAPAEPVDPDAAKRALEVAETAMWDHYLEWSAILRAQVKRPRYLVLMGLSEGRKAPADTSTTTDDAPDNRDNDE